MPLEEISGNVPRRPSSLCKGHHHEATTVLSAPSNAIQSMLKTTTELGDLGQFGTGSSRLSRSGSRVQNTRLRSGSYDPSFASALRHNRTPHEHRSERHHGPRHALSTSTLSARYTSRSNLGSYAPSYRPRRQRQQLPPSNSPHPSIYTHRSLVTLRSQQDVHSVQSDSPGRMRRPPFRAPSPAYTDNRSLHTPYQGFFRAPSTGTVASSPAQTFRHGPYMRDVNGSYGSLNRYPPAPYNSGRSAGMPSFAPPSRYQTPDYVPRNGLTPIPGSMAPSAGIPQSPTGSTAPPYYDYTESFTEETRLSPDGTDGNQRPPLNMDQTIWEDMPMVPRRDAQTPFGMREGSKFYPSELPTKHNRRPSEQSRKSWKSDRRPGSKPTSRHGPGRVSTEIQKRALDPKPSVMKQASNPDIRRSRSEDNGTGDTARPDLHRTSTVSRKSGTSSPSTAFFAGASRSARDLALLAARVHSPVPGQSSQLPKSQLRSERKPPDQMPPEVSPALVSTEATVKRTPEWQIPSLTFRPLSFMPDSPATSKRPRTSEASFSRAQIEIHSPMPKRPTSSQSRRRFSKILDVENADPHVPIRGLAKQSSCIKKPILNMVEESPPKRMIRADDFSTPVSVCSHAASLAEPGYNSMDDRYARISGVTSHDKSTVESLLDRHIESLGLQPDRDEQNGAMGSDRAHGLLPDKNDTGTDTSNTIRLTEILANVPVMERDRPATSASQQFSSLGTLDRLAMRPRRLFASMDARVPGTIQEQSLSLSLEPRQTVGSRPSFGWQTLHSRSGIGNSTIDLAATLTSGQLGDIDTSETKSKMRIKRRSLMSTSVSDASILSSLSSGAIPHPKASDLHKRSKSDMIARQTSHRRRRIRIRLKMKTRSKTTGDLSDSTPIGGMSSADSTARGHNNDVPNSPVMGYAELSGDSVQPSFSNLAKRLSQPPSIPNRWSSIIASMPLPGKKSHEVTRKPSMRSHKSHRSNTSIVEPINNTRINRPIPRMGSVPQLGPPDIEPPLTSSELNLSIPYAEVPSTVPPTLRETKSFFSDNSSAQRQKGTLRQKLRLHSLRNMIPVPTLASVTPRRRSTGVKLSHSCQMKGRPSVDGLDEPRNNTIPMTDFAYRRRKVMEKLKDWWKRQCLQKVVQGRKARKARDVPGTMAW